MTETVAWSGSLWDVESAEDGLLRLSRCHDRHALARRGDVVVLSAELLD